MKKALYLAIYERDNTPRCDNCGKTKNYIATSLTKLTGILETFRDSEVLEADIPEEADEWTLKKLEAVYEIEETLLLSQYEEKPIRRYI